MSDDYEYVKDAQSVAILAYLNFKVMDTSNGKLRCYFRSIITERKFILFADDHKNDARFMPQDGMIDFYVAGNENGIYRLTVAKRGKKVILQSVELVTPTEPREAVLRKIMEAVPQRGE